jgi:LEA14-like dessication related protein
MNRILPVLFLFLTFGCSGPEAPTFVRVDRVQFKSVSVLGSPTVTIVGDAIFDNPNSMGAEVTEIDLDVYINDKKMTRVRQDVSATMPANSDFTLPLSFEVPIEEVLNDLKRNVFDVLKKKTVDYRLDGHIKVGFGNVEVAVPVEHEGTEVLKFNVKLGAS